MLRIRVTQFLGLAVVAACVGSVSGLAVADHDKGNGKSQDKKGKGKKNHVWCLVSDTTPAGDPADDFSGVSVKQNQLSGLTLEDVTSLSTDFFVEEGDCGGGSPRFQISLDTDNDGDHDGNVFVYLGPSPSYTGCALQTWESSGNLVEDPDPRWDTSQIGGTFYDTYGNALALAGGASVLGVSLVVDSGWLFATQRQVICVDDAEVNGLKLNEAFGGATKTKMK